MRAGMILFIGTVLTAAASTAMAEEQRAYRVRPGDTLGEIAQQQLGTARRWRDIADINGIARPSQLRVGQVITLPAPVPLADGAAVQRHLLIESPSSDNWQGQLLWLGAAWLLATCCLWGACWFSMVETTLPRCAGLALVLQVLSIATLGVCLHLFTNMSFEHWTYVIVGTVVAYMAAGVFLTRQILMCRWRSVLTVFTMSSVVAYLIAIVFGLVFFTLDRFQIDSIAQDTQAHPTADHTLRATTSPKR